jgi:hypothetical protein
MLFANGVIHSVKALFVHRFQVFCCACLVQTVLVFLLINSGWLNIKPDGSAVSTG